MSKLQERLDKWFSGTDIKNLTDKDRKLSIEKKVADVTEGVRGESKSTYHFRKQEIHPTDCLVLKDDDGNKTYYLKCLLTVDEYNTIVHGKGRVRGKELMGRMLKLQENFTNFAKNPQQEITDEQAETICSFVAGCAQHIIDSLSGKKVDKGIPSL